MAKTVAVCLTPKASSNRIGESRTLTDGTEQFAIYVTAIPENGKANDAMPSCYRNSLASQNRDWL
jgi:uncharacterized protein YggU (UPF0235/DUF167 family)